jgi:leucyl/phenylalanyl-tRNA--protein transferase
MTSWEARPQPVGKSQLQFPPPSDWPDPELLTLGADLEPATVIDAYRRGLFPMGVSELQGRLGWWSPDPRGILPLDGLRVTRSMRQSAKRFAIRVDTCFVRVMRACASPSRGGTWITEDFIDGYTRLHELGWAHSVEVFNQSGELAGGLYGVRIGGYFSGESMFHVERDASKVALMALVDLMRSSGMTLLDVQWCSEHLASLGAIAIPRPTYLTRLAAALRKPASTQRQKNLTIASRGSPEEGSPRRARA